MMLFWEQLLKKMMKPGGIDCNSVLEKLYEYIDEELEDRKLVEAIRKHLEVCKSCFPQYEFEKAFLRFLGDRDRGKVEVPAELRRKVFQRILEEESQG